jgi:hypothetical protein
VGSYSIDGIQDYLACRPMIRDAGRIITGYINLYESGLINQALVRDRITKGVKFLLDEQLKQDYLRISGEDETGAFMRWQSRPGVFTPNTGGSEENKSYAQRPEQFDTGFAIEALTASYFFFKKHGVTGGLFTLNDIVDAINATAGWLIVHVPGHDGFTNNGCSNTGHSRNTNQFTNSLWALTNAYKVTKNPLYLETAIDGFERTAYVHQQSDGVWSYYVCGLPVSIDYHDSQGHYTGGILRAMIEMYDQLFCEYESKYFATNAVPHYSKEDLRGKILLTINHFLNSGMAQTNLSPNGVRLINNGEIADYKYYGQQDNDVELEMFDALAVFQRSDLYRELDDVSRERIDIMTDAILIPGVDRVLGHSYGSYAAAFRSMSYYKRREHLVSLPQEQTKLVLYSPNGDAAGENKIGTYNMSFEEHTGYSNVGGYYHLMATGNFDDIPEDDEIAMYTRNDGRIAIYKSGYNAYTGCTPVYAGSIYTNFEEYDQMDALDYDGDGKDEIVMFNRYDNGLYNRIDVWDNDGVSFSGYSSAPNPFKLMTTGDFDQDGKDEVALYSDSDGVIRIYNPDQATTNGVTLYSGSGAVYVGSIATGFTLHDMMESIDYAGDSDAYNDEIVMYNKTYAGVDNRIDLLRLGTGYISSKYSNAGSTFQAMSTGDFNNDGNDEIAFYSQADGQISLYNPEHVGSSSVAYTGYTPVYAGSIYTLFTNYDMMEPLSTNRRDDLQSFARTRTPNEEKQVVHETLGEIVAYPNPASSELHIVYSIPCDSQVKVTLSNVTGQEVQVLEDNFKTKGNHRLQYIRQSESGLYLLNIAITGRTVKTLKVVFKR